MPLSSYFIDDKYHRAVSDDVAKPLVAGFSFSSATLACRNTLSIVAFKVNDLPFRILDERAFRRKPSLSLVLLLRL